MPEAKELLNRIDLLIDGPYVRELDDGLSLRGSSNQRVLPLTRRYLKDLNRYGQPNRPVETFRHGAEVHFVGVADHQKSMNIAAQMRRYMESNPSVRLYMGGTGPVRNIPLKRIPIQSNEERMKALLEYMEKHTEPKKGE